MGGRHARRPGKRRGLLRPDELRYADESAGESYARCKTLLGNGRMTLALADGREVQGRVRGSMYKRVWINVGDLVLCCTRSLGEVARGDADEVGKFDIVHKFTMQDERILHRYGELPRTLISATVVSVAFGENDLDDDTVVFEDI